MRESNRMLPFREGNHTCPQRHKYSEMVGTHHPVGARSIVAGRFWAVRGGETTPRYGCEHATAWQLFPACTGMSGYSRRGREASGPPLVISKYSPARARTSSIALLCPPAPPALGREFRFQKAMMALARAEIPPISDSMKLNCDS